MSLERLQPYFNVTTKDVVTRVMLSLVPFNKKFFENYNNRPDLYGPFWILTSLVAAIFISGNVSRYITWPSKEVPFSYSFKTVPVATSVIYGVGIGLPLFIKLILNLYGTGDPATRTVTTVQSIGIYCYSFSSMIIATILCGLIPYSIAHWILISLAGVQSIGFLLITYHEDLKKELETKQRWALIVLICLVQIGMLALLKFYFFSHF